MDILTRVTKRLIDIDDDLLEKATRILDAETMKETVNRALEEAVKAELRRRHVERLMTMRGMDLDVLLGDQDEHDIPG